MHRMMIAGAGVLMLAACVNEPELTGEMAFMENCAACHSADATGSRALGLALEPPAPDLTGLSARNGGVFPRDYVMSTIDGYSRGQHSTSPMPEFGAGDLGETVVVENADGTGTPVPATLLALADYLQRIQR
jgi:mono/diheme cytochrome c family protein